MTVPGGTAGANRWAGGHYELAMIFEVDGDQAATARAVLETLWSRAEISGPMAARGADPATNPCFDLGSIDLIAGSGLHLYGQAVLPNGAIAPCGTIVFPEQSGRTAVSLFLPMASLGESYSVGGFPFGDDGPEADGWRNSLDRWLATVGMVVFVRTPFQFGLVGFETDSIDPWQEVLERGKPELRRNGVLWPSSGGVEFLPRTER
ncbi:MAG: hypothetical protein ACREJ2_07330 [Planctomycetota bacterium]